MPKLSKSQLDADLADLGNSPEEVLQNLIKLQIVADDFCVSSDCPIGNYLRSLGWNDDILVSNHNSGKVSAHNDKKKFIETLIPSAVMLFIEDFDENRNHEKFLPILVPA
jgi:hypothetical protein